jgi:hypothetical protein
MSKLEDLNWQRPHKLRHGRCVSLTIFICVALAMITSCALRLLNVRIEVNIVRDEGKIKPKSDREKVGLPNLLCRSLIQNRCS